MAQFKVNGNTKVLFDSSSAATLDMSSYIDSVGDGLGKVFQDLDVTTFADDGERIIIGIETSQTLTVEGPFDDTASTGPDVVFGTLVGGTARTVEFWPVGTASGARGIRGEMFCTSYMPAAASKETVRYTATFRLDGQATLTTHA